MKKNIAILAFLIIIFPSLLAFSEEKNLAEANGYDWQQFSLPQKVGYCAGFINGVLKADERLNFYLVMYKWQNKDSDINKDDLLPFYGVTVGQIMDGLDAFYKDYKNMQIRIKDAIFIICKEVKGTDSEWVEREKQILRMPEEKQSIARSNDYIRAEIKKGTYYEYEVRDNKIYEKETNKEIVLNTQEDVTNFYKNASYEKEQKRGFKSLMKDTTEKVQDFPKSINADSIYIGIIIILAVLLILVYMKRKK